MESRGAYPEKKCVRHPRDYVENKTSKKDHQFEETILANTILSEEREVAQFNGERASKRENYHID